MAKKHLTEEEQMLLMQRILKREEDFEMAEVIRDGKYDFNNKRLDAALREVDRRGAGNRKAREEADGADQRSDEEEEIVQIGKGIKKAIASKINPWN